MTKEYEYIEVASYNFDDGDSVEKTVLLDMLEHIDKGKDLLVELDNDWLRISVREEREVTEEMRQERLKAKRQARETSLQYHKEEIKRLQKQIDAFNKAKEND